MLLSLLLALPALAEAPEVPVCSLLTPTFSIDGKNPSMGAMTAIKQGDRTVLVTAHHLFGPSGGLPAQLSAADLATKVQSVTLRDAFTNADCGRADKALTVDGAKPMDAGDNSGDLALFQLYVDTSVNRLTTKAKPVAPRGLAEAAPAKGDTVYVIAAVPDNDKRAWKAEVVEVNDKALYYSVEDKAFTATSGASVVTAEGKLVGLHLGGGTMDDGALIGTATPWTSLKKHLAAE